MVTHELPQIESLDWKKISSIIDSIASEELNKEHNPLECVGCRLVKMFEKDDCLHGIYLNLLEHAIETNNVNKLIEDTFIMGFELAWLYRDNLETEKLMGEKDARA